MTVAVVGLGKLGAPLAGCLAESGVEVLGVDRDAQVVARLASGSHAWSEPGLNSLLEQNRERLSWGQDIAEAVARSQATFVVLPTPSRVEGDFCLETVLGACQEVGLGLSMRTDWHVVVLVSTVMPGDCERRVIPALEAVAQKVCGKDFSFCYSPEFIALGSVIHDMQEPDLILIGESDPRAGDFLQRILTGVCKNTPYLFRVQLVNAEIAKLSINTYITMKISFANTLARLCERIPEGDSAVVSEILGCDSRIGPKYLRGSLAYGGPCFPRDTGAFECFARSLGQRAYLAQATAQVNQDQHEFLAGWVRRHLRGRSRVSILGLAYKCGTPVTDESPGLILVQHLLPDPLVLSVYDPQSRCPLRASNLVCCSSVEECVESAELVVITTPWPQFAALVPSRWAGKIVLDCWGLLERDLMPENCEYFQLGQFHCQG